MPVSNPNHVAAWPAAVLAVAAVALASPAHAQTANTTVSNVNTLNLLSPFLGLDATPTGQATLTASLNSSVAVNNNAATSPTVEATSISDKSLMGGTSTTITLANGTIASYGPGSNLAGGLPAQAIQNGATNGTVIPVQPYGGLGQLGSAFQSAVGPSGAAVPSTVKLLTDSYNFTSSDLGIAKNYFANGTTNGTTTAVAPGGTSLPTANGYPNKATSVYDTAYGVTNTGANQDVYGDSRPVQVAPGRINGYDPNALTGLASNPSFPSGHTTYAYTDGILTAMLVPQNYQSMLLRASEYGNSRIDLGVHYPLDIIASRSFVSYDLSQMLNANAGYTSANTQADFTAAQPALTSYLTTQAAATSCGTVAACAAGNPYNTYSLATYGANTPTANATLTSNSQIYGARLTYGLPTLSYAVAPAEAAPAGGPDAAVLLAPLYGGSTAAAKVIAPGGGLYGTLSTGTINRIIANTEGNAIAAFYGTPLSYWSRLNLYDAASYFGNVTGSLTLAPGDQVLTNVTVGNGGTLRGPGAAVGSAVTASAVTVGSGGLLSPGAAGVAGGLMTITGSLVLQAGGTLQFQATGTGAGQYDQLVVTGMTTLGGLLDFELTNGFRLPYGLSTYDLLEFSSSAGDFSGLVFENTACNAAGNDDWQCGGDVNIDEVLTANSLSLRVTSVPEPATLSLLGCAVAGLLWVRRRGATAA